MRFVFFTVFMSVAQVALHRSLTLAFQLGRKRQMALGALQLALGAAFLVFLRIGGNGGSFASPVRPFVIEPVLALEALSIPLMLLLGVSVSLAQRVPPRPADPEALPEPRRVFLQRAATGLVAATFAAVTAGIEQAELEPQLSRVDVPIANLPRNLEGLTIAQLSDIHAGALMTEARMRRIAGHARTLGADLVVFTGDLLDISPRAAKPFANAFGDLKGRLGTFACLGNHDAYAGVKATMSALHEAGITPLRNQGLEVEGLWICGVDDQAAGPPDIAKALAKSDPRAPRIMLAHRPSLADACARGGANLVLSGHTHGGQIALTRTFTLARTLGPYTMGLYELGSSHLYVHRGMGTVGPAPVRLGSPPEIALLTLRRA